MAKRIFILITGLNFGGAEKQALMIASGLRERGWHVTLLSLLTPPAADHRVFDTSIQIETLNVTGLGTALRALFSLVRRVRAARPNVILTFMFHANILGRIAGVITRVPVVSSIRAEHFGGRIRDSLERITGFFGRATVVNSSKVGEALVQRKVVSRSRVKVIPNAVALRDSALLPAEERENFRKSVGIDAADFFWLAVGRLEKPKDYSTLLRAVAALRTLRKNARLRIAGTGCEVDMLEKLCANLDLLNVVQLLGFRTDVERLLDAADGLVLSSAWESSPNAVLEAMASSKLVVATDVGGLSDLIRPGHTGFLVKAQNPEALADCMHVAMMLPEEERRRIGAAGQAQIRLTSGAEQICEAWQDLLLASLPSRREPSKS